MTAEMRPLPAPDRSNPNWRDDLLYCRVCHKVSYMVCEWCDRRIPRGYCPCGRKLPVDGTSCTGGPPYRAEDYPHHRRERTRDWHRELTSRRAVESGTVLNRKLRDLYVGESHLSQRTSGAVCFRRCFSIEHVMGHKLGA